MWLWSISVAGILQFSFVFDEHKLGSREGTVQSSYEWKIRKKQVMSLGRMLHNHEDTERPSNKSKG